MSENADLCTVKTHTQTHTLWGFSPHFIRRKTDSYAKSNLVSLIFFLRCNNGSQVDDSHGPSAVSFDNSCLSVSLSDCTDNGNHRSVCDGTCN